MCPVGVAPHMVDGETVELVLRIWVLVAVASGIGLVIFGGQSVAIVGVLLIIVGIVSIMPAFQSYAGEWEAEYFQKKEE